MTRAASTTARTSAPAGGTGQDDSVSTVVVAGVTKQFPGTTVPVLRDIHLDVAQGEFLTIVGSSGCGKSTLLAMLAGLDKPTSGSIDVVGGRPGLVFQEHALFPWLTAGENVSLALKLRGVPKKERPAEVARLLESVHLEGLAGRRVHELSGGQRQRVAIARALAQDATILLLDEPFAALDAITRDALHVELVRLWQEFGLTVVFVTHNVREAVRLGSRIVLMGAHPGRIVQEWNVDMPQPRRIEDANVGQLARQVTRALEAEVSDRVS
jgi:NitT/TauT family transport system ATP-binding protein